MSPTDQPAPPSGPFAAGTQPAADGLVAPTVDPIRLEQRGRSWLLWSFLLCPCHLPWTLAILATVFASTSIGVLVRDHAWVAGTVITAAWVVGTGYGLRLIRQAEKAGGACAVREPTAA